MSDEQTVRDEDLQRAVSQVVYQLKGIDDLYDHQYDLLRTILTNDHIFYTSSTNSGKTLPTVMYPQILKKLNSYGYSFPKNPKVLVLTPLNSLQLSHINSVSALGIDCAAISAKNVKDLLVSNISVLFVSPETLKITLVSNTLLQHRRQIVLKVVDEVHLCKFKYKFKNIKYYCSF